MKKRRLLITRLAIISAVAIYLLTPLSRGSASPSQQAATNTPIEHLIVVMQQNHTFDNYFGTYPGANGIPEGTCMPVDPTNADDQACIEPYYIGESSIADLDHSYATFQQQYNNGQMDGFIQALNEHKQDGRIAMGYYDDRD
jgi:phospholipase C